MKKIRPIRMATHGKAWKDLIKVHRRVLVVEVLNLFFFVNDDEAYVIVFLLNKPFQSRACTIKHYGLVIHGKLTDFVVR
jgi:hypothetical protein